MDTNSASITRVHNAMLGGTENYEADRIVRDRLLAADAEFPAAAQDVRAFVVRAVQYLTRDVGLTQLLDCGLFLPIANNSHSTAQQINPETSVVYASVDPFVLSQARKQLAGNDRAHVTEANISRADRVLNDPVVRKYLDFSQPMGLLHVLSLQHMPDHDDPWLTMAQYIDALAPGSYVVVSHMLDPGPQHELASTISRIGKIYRTSLGTGWARTAERILDFLPNLELVTPGLVLARDWRPDHPHRTPPGAMQRLVACAVAYKP